MQWRRNNIILIKVYKRNINNEIFKKTLEELIVKSSDSNTNTNLDNNIKETICQLNKTKESPKQDVLIYEDIIKHLQESEKILQQTRDKLKVIKEANLNIEKMKKNDKSIDCTDASINETISNVKKSIFDISWLDPFINFMHNHTSLILTIGGGALLGGMWYFNNVGYINIGSMLSRLGITLLSNNNTADNQANQSSVITTTRISANIGHTFFRQLGKKVLIRYAWYNDRKNEK